MVSADGISDAVASTMKRLYSRGLVSGVGGNVSARLHDGAGFLITPSGYFKGGVAKGDLVRIGADGEVLSKGVPSSDLPSHLSIYSKRGAVGAVVHGHPPTAVALITAGVDLPVMTPEHSVLVTKVGLVDFAPPGEACARAIAPVIRDSDVIGIRNHGFFALGKDLHDAASKIEVIEESAKIYVTMRQLGRVSPLGPEQVRKVRPVYGRE